MSLMKSDGVVKQNIKKTPSILLGVFVSEKPFLHFRFIFENLRYSSLICRLVVAW
ncbi:Hypothetical protein FORC18_3182 [Vibrio parahaemolyticus]|nr:hypothetical protein FORC8_3175 [Vibrio parahaemolyticus]APE85795.1 Hypothetical protein FORC18_3182 [Vibrio parahaemolyticus]